MNPILIIIPPERFRDEELFITKDELEKGGYKTVIASTKTGSCPGSKSLAVFRLFQIPLQPVHSFFNVFKRIGIGKTYKAFSSAAEVDTGSDTHMGMFEYIEGKTV
jgi:hypothetical protein